ncbi:MAG TPA: tRNA preQ1(34) S-adenosylmethionine ribosyltransferase-isomerase QueA [Pyrinomonadaceae bacterium]|nr:tRNA preQ1(34) S-adenosylmethionine ribosyltransferase-isomerase QueA [Pyrinomonadaceae bacterium]
MQLSEFDYDLPEELIAQQPLPRRDASRMLVVNRDTQRFLDSKFETLPEYLQPGDVIVVNNTRVFPARLIGQRDPSGGRVEVLLVREIEAEDSSRTLGESTSQVWEALVRPGHRLKSGARIRFGSSSLQAEVLEDAPNGFRVLRFEGKQPLETLIDELGETPLPPYIKRPEGTSPTDDERYQTVFASEKGAIAAPTAGLHFTPRVKEAILARQARVIEITLHVGYGTFQPVRVNDLRQHRVDAEYYEISEEAARAINDSRGNGGRVIAVGTTTVRALESAANADGLVRSEKKKTGLTIIPGYQFRVTDALLTNFHLPRSSLLLLVSAFAGQNLTLEAYRKAVSSRFRFYSYGDCMLVI